MIEAVPNISEGRDLATVETIAEAIRSTPEVLLLNVSSDHNHNRTVLTYASESSEAMEEATLRLFDIAVGKIDLRRHEGAHPRVGAGDVVPFVPLRGSEMGDCVALAERVGRKVAKDFELPVYLYEHAARDASRRELPAIRSGGFENFARKIQQPGWTPDFGPKKVHPSAGVSIIGARVPLIAFNVQLATDRFDVAEKTSPYRRNHRPEPIERPLLVRRQHPCRQQPGQDARQRDAIPDKDRGRVGAQIAQEKPDRGPA